jgi:hypothetical protein
LGITLSVNIQWGTYLDVFGWVKNLSVVYVNFPDINPIVVLKIVDTGLLLVQPLCCLRMFWLSLEHQHKENLIPYAVKMYFNYALRPQYNVLTPFLYVFWSIFLLLIIVLSAIHYYLAAGFIFIFFGVPSLYLTLVNIYRKNIWKFINIKYTKDVQIRQYENMEMQEGVFLCFIFVSSYSFVINFFISIMITWKDMTISNQAILIIGFLLYLILPLLYLYHHITNEYADRSYSIFQLQLVSPFTDNNMYMKIILLIESALFSLLVLLPSDANAALSCGLIVNLIFLAHAVMSKPFGGCVETISDLMVRISSTITLLFGLIINGLSVDYTPTFMSTILLFNALLCAIWYIYCLDPKEMCLKCIFLILQSYAQEKSLYYTKETIPLLPRDSIKKITNSPIEFYVLSSNQRVNFITLRKFDFLTTSDSVKSLRDLNISWLDLNQAGYDVKSLIKLGYSKSELIYDIVCDLDDMGDRRDIQNLYETVVNDNILTYGHYNINTLTSQYMLGVFYKDMGQHVLAMNTLHECYIKQKEHLGATDENTLKTLQFIGEYYTFLGMYYTYPTLILCIINSMFY